MVAAKTAPTVRNLEKAVAVRSWKSFPANFDAARKLLTDFPAARNALERPCASQEGGSMLLRREGGFLRRGGGFLRRGGGFLRRGGGS